MPASVKGTAPKTVNEEVGFLLRILDEPGDLIRARLRKKKMLKLKVRKAIGKAYSEEEKNRMLEEARIRFRGCPVRPRGGRRSHRSSLVASADRGAPSSAPGGFVSRGLGRGFGRDGALLLGGRLDDLDAGRVPDDDRGLRIGVERHARRDRDRR